MHATGFLELNLNLIAMTVPPDHMAPEQRGVTRLMHETQSEVRSTEHRVLVLSARLNQNKDKKSIDRAVPSYSVL